MDAELASLQSEVQKAVKHFPAMVVPAAIPKTLPLLEKFREGKKPLAHKGALLFIQHQLGHFPPRVSAGTEDGLSKDRTWFLDIPYSTNSVVYDWIATRFGADHLPDRMTDSLAPYKSTQAARLRDILVRIADASVPGPLLVVDDGAYFVRHLSRMLKSDPDQAETYRGSMVVEQTTRGHRALEAAENDGVLSTLEIRAVSVACSRTKKIVEAPFIGASIARRLFHVLRERSVNASRVLVVGFGSIGSACALALRDRWAPAPRIDVVEKDRAKLPMIRAAGFRPLETVPGPAHVKYDLVVGCTGGTSFKPADRQILDDQAVLASGSSASVEFDRENWVDEADRDGRDAFELVGDREEMRKCIHSALKFRFEGNQELTLLSGGFPVNFDGKLTQLPTAAIEPTHCLMYAAVREVLSMPYPGVSPLSDEADWWLLHEAVKGVSSSV